MKILITQIRPESIPVRTYETTMIYVGFRFRYDTHKKTVSSMEKQPDGTVTFTEAPTDIDVFARGYSSEQVRVTIYSESPRIWVEETSPYDFFTFVQQPTQPA